VRDPAERLRDMLDAIAALDRYGDRDRESFDHDELLQVWFLRHLQILGEAAAGLPQELRDLAPDVPWPSIVGMRNVGSRAPGRPGAEAGLAAAAAGTRRPQAIGRRPTAG
jgi:uncharacterized protein with HEPN domain